MSEESVHEPQMGLNFEKVWAMLQEASRERKEMSRETDLKFRETDLKFRETDLKFQETARRFQETEKLLNRTTKLVGDLSNKFGELSEYIIVPNMVAKFNNLGFAFTKAGRNFEYRGPDNKILTEVDVLLENGDVVMIVEIKSDLTEKHISHHLDRMEKLRAYGDAHGDKRKLMGALASPVMRDDIKSLAYAAGFYVIEQSGDTVIIEKPEGFIPRQW